MADFNAKINLDADNSKALRKIEQVEKAVNKLDNAVNKVDVKVRGTQQAEQQVNKLYKALERLESSALSKLPQSLQMVIAYLKAANAGMGEFAKRAILASNAVGDIGRVSLAPIVRAQTQAITKFNDMGGALVRVNRQIIELRNNINSLIGPIEAVSVKFLNPTNFSPKLPGNIGFGGGAGTQYYGGAIGPNPQRLLGGSNQKLLPPGRLSDLDKALQALGLFDAALRKAVTQVDQFGRGGTLQQGPSPAFNLGSIRALEAELRAKQALVNNAVIGTRAFKRYSRELQQTTRQLERAQERTKGFFGNLTNPQSKLGASVIGAGFPLITGGGIGSIAGGGIGGALGGFAGSIGGSALGQAFDQAAAAIVKTAEVTRSTANAYEFLSEKQLFSSDSARQLADELAELGRVEELAALATRELVNMIGNEGVQNLQDLDNEWQELLSNLAELGLAIAGFISQFLKPVIELLNNAVGGINTQNRFSALQKDLAGTAQGEALAKDIAAVSGVRETKGSRKTNDPLTVKEMDTLLQKYSGTRPITAKIPVTDQDRKTFAPPKAKAAGKSDEDRIRERIELLRIETAAIQQKAVIDQQISQARIAEDQSLENKLRLSSQLIGIQEGLAKALVRETDERIKQELIVKAQAQAEAAKAAAANREAERIAKANQSYNLQIETLGLQLQAVEAITREEEKQAELQLRLLRLREANKDLAPEQLAALEEATRKLFEATNLGPLDAYIKNTSKALADTEMQMVRIVQTVEGQLASGITNFFTGIIDGSKSAEEAFADMLKGMGQALIQQAAIMIAQYIAIGIARIFAGMPTMSNGNTIDISKVDPGTVNSLGGLGSIGGGYRASGGPVDNATPYIVGERGPELFVPRSSGTIVNNEQSRAQLDMYSPGNAVDAPAGPMNVNMNYSGPTMAFDDKRYLPIEAVPAIIKDAAKQGEQRALASMRNRVSTRNRVGI